MPGRGLHAERLVWAPVIVKASPVSDDAAGMLDGLEAMSMHALFF